MRISGSTYIVQKFFGSLRGVDDNDWARAIPQHADAPPSLPYAEEFFVWL